MLPHDAAVMRFYYESLDLGQFEPLAAQEIEELSAKVRQFFLLNP
jgi:hypothetical protein